MSTHRRGMKTAEKPKDFKGSIGKLVRFCKPFVPVILIALICEMVGVITRLIGPNKISEITDLISTGLTGKIDLDGPYPTCAETIDFHRHFSICHFEQTPFKKKDVMPKHNTQLDYSTVTSGSSVFPTSM